MEGVIFNMANKRVFKLATASAVAASALVAAVPASAASVTYEQAEKQVNKAREAANGLHAEYTRDADYVTQVDSKEARDELARAKAKIAALSSAKEKAYLSSRIQGTIDTVARANAYNNAVRAGGFLQDAAEEVNAALANGVEDLAAAQTAQEKLNLYYKVSQENFGKVYGKEIQANFKKEYITEDLVAFKADAYYGIATRSHLVEADKAIKANDVATAEKYLGYAQASVAKVTAEGLKTALTSSWTKLSADLEAIKVPKVESVSAINARELVIKFNKAVDKTDAEDLANYALAGESFVGTTPVVSEDGKTVTLRSADELKVTNAKLTISPIKTKANATVSTEEYNTLLTYADTTAPSVGSVEAKGTTAVIKFAEPVQSEGTVSLDGVALASPANYTLSADGKTLTVSGLTAEKSYRVDVVGAKDFANNTSNPIGLNFTVAKPVVDSSKPTVSTSVSGTVITFDFSEELVKQDLDDADTTVAEYAKVTVGGSTYYLTDAEIKDANDKTKFTLNAATALGTANFINASVKVENFKDAANNTGDAFTFSTTLAKDTTKPSFASSSAKLLVADDKAVGTDVDAVYLTFNEPVKVASGTLTKKVQNGIAYTTANTTTVSDTSGTGVDVDGNGKIEGSELNTVKLSVDLDANSTYTFELAAGLVTDIAGNPITDTLTFNVSTGTFTPAPGTVTDSVVFAGTPVVVSGTENNVFTLEYAVDVTSSATNAANYTLGGQALPSGTQLQFVDGTKKVRFTLPVGSISANGSYVFEAKNIVDTAGNTIKSGKQSTLVTLKESIAPTATKVTVVDSKTFTVDFTEAIADATATGLVVKIAGTTVTPVSATVSGGKLTVKTLADFALTDSISVEFKSTNLVDANGNKVKDGVVSK
jgi:SbsC C-terminal domain/Bacterial Ig-like domain